MNVFLPGEVLEFEMDRVVICIWIGKPYIAIKYKVLFPSINAMLLYHLN